jgi:hypothetical protein
MKVFSIPRRDVQLVNYRVGFKMTGKNIMKYPGFN